MTDVKTHCEEKVIDYRMIQLVDIETIDQFEGSRRLNSSIRIHLN